MTDIVAGDSARQSGMKCLFASCYEALHRLDYNSDPKETISQGHGSNKLDIKLSFVYYILLS